MDDLTALDIAARAWDQRLSAVSPEVFDQPSVCGDWSVYELVNHVHGGGRRYLMLMQGAQAEELVPTRTQDHVRPDPLAAYRRWQVPLAAAFAEPGAFERVCHHRVGDLPGQVLLRMRTLELALHAWDLARSLDISDVLDEDMCSYALTECRPLIEAFREAGFFAAAGTESLPRETAQHQLIRLSGRA